jgi:hypothetical protein
VDRSVGQGSPSKFEKWVWARPIRWAVVFIVAMKAVKPGPYALASA